MYYKPVRGEAASLPSLKLRGIVVPAFLRYIIGKEFYILCTVHHCYVCHYMLTNQKYDKIYENFVSGGPSSYRLYSTHYKCYHVNAPIYGCGSMTASQ